MALIQTSDFVGRYLLEKTPTNLTMLGNYIDDFTNEYIYKVLGKELGDLFLADIDLGGGTPTLPEFTVIYEELSFNSTSNNELFYSKGFKKMILGFVYYEYLSEITLKGTASGGTRSQTEISTMAFSMNEINKKYNDSVDYSRAIQRYIFEHPEDYPLFEGKRLLYNY